MPVSLWWLVSEDVVLFVSHSSEMGGAERLLIYFATVLRAEVDLACPEGRLASAARASGIRVFPLRERRPNIRASVQDRVLAVARLLGYARELRALIRDLEPELVIAWGMRPALVCLLGPRLSCPVVFQQNDLIPGPMIGRLVRRAARRADLVTVLSDAIAADLDPRDQLRSRLRTIHPGVEVERFPVGAPPADPPEVVVLGAVAPSKRLDLALEAFALAKRRRPDLRLRVVGEPFKQDGDDLLRELAERAAKPDLAGAVEFAGALADPRPALSSATCLLHCAEREAFGLAVLEALACARPVVVPAVGGPNEIVDRSCGIRYRPGDPGAAAEGLLAIVSNPDQATEMGVAGRERARRFFDRDASRSRYAAALEPLLEGARSPLDKGRAKAPPAAREPQPHLLAIVTVTHNSAQHLERLLDSVERHLPGVPVVVVDCASSDRSPEIADARGSARTVRLSTNVGFARACNRGLEEVREPVTALLNPDVELLDASLLALADEALRQERPQRLLAPLVVAPDGSRQDSVHPAPTSAPDLMRAVLPAGPLPGRLAAPLAPWRATRARPVGWAVGCALIAQTETLRSLGPFDERIFLYGEDLDLGLRAAADGVTTWFWPEGRVLHHQAHASGPAFGGEPFDLLARARHDVVVRRLGRRRARIDDAAQAVTFSSRMLFKPMLGRSAARERRQLEALRSARRADGLT